MQNAPDRPKVRLPYEPRRIDFGTWVWVHRAGICATIIALLLFGIAFVAWRITVIDNVAHQVVYLEMEPPPELQQKPEVKEVAPVDYSSVSNRASNENADADQRQRDAAQGRELTAEAEGAGDRMDANRAAYEEGLRREQQMIANARRRTDDNSSKAQSAKYGGNVSASYSFTNPVRHDERLDIPTYRCVGGGQVVVAAALDREGRVVDAKVESGSSHDTCLQREALASARASRFNLDPSAPSRQHGTITYLFVPQ
jgi:TonB family protein